MAATLPLDTQRLAQRGEAAQLAADLTSYPASNLDNGFLAVTPPIEAEHDAWDLAASLEPIDKNAKPLVAIIGVGYVGTHLFEVFSREYNTLGFEVSERRVQDLKSCFEGNQRVSLTSTSRHLHTATHFLISVPTLLLPDKSVDTSYLRSALKTVAAHARPGSTVVIESSVAIGMTRDLLGPIAKIRGFYAGMSPERVDPGRTEPPAYAIPKVISGLDDVVPGSLEAIRALYTRVFDRIVPVSKPEVAEMTKLYENCQRMIGIAYANEMAEAARAHGINPYEVCQAASTKPFGYTSFFPGVGVGGHCIPVNPHYLLSNSSFPLLAAASEVMTRRPATLAARAVEELTKDRSNHGRKPRVLVVGIGFKAGQSTLSNSPGLDLIKHLSLHGSVQVQFADPLVRQEDVPQVSRLADCDWNRKILACFDRIIVTMRQVGLDFGLLDDIPDVHVEW
ncbi:UDP-glucose/GDP-mannose dehydrogenase family, central domain-containing protein [Hirsutella rhossiliensis]|uniref:UDP-glucose/GDP-mannose dehydrogenase family, central domain-containing protein n=1 Tax=Hirsutella rhossiliensis TaxID=111463 RepID=A0A9P8N6P7_9HYPO|nr:UDP-glucose/GDP-mannose dehydrogenase family, central domain-containing protein [Hirsutella rhossiliensis]KAH0967982.1 UDP-glucose/GDP-mannose dehydrogenase family, central domain-containing protein [Hirsutella rhossiliensis]